MKRILLIMLSIIIIVSYFMVVPVFAEKTTNTSVNTQINTKINTDVNTDMYYFNSKKTVVNDKGIAVSINEAGSIATCTKLSTSEWKIITNKKVIEFEDIIIVNNNFMAVAEVYDGSLLLTSSDGIKWTEKVINDYYISKLFYANNSFLTIAIDSRMQHGVFQTNDFKTFIKIEAKNNIGLNIYPKEEETNLLTSDIAYFNGTYFLSGMYGKGNPRSMDSEKGIVISSKDLKTWKVCTETQSMLRYMVQSGDTLIAYGGDSHKARLSDNNLISTGGANSYADTNMVYSKDGKNFKTCNISFETNAGAFDQITYIGGKFFGLTYRKIGISSDGINWDTLSDYVDWKYGGYYDGKYVAVGNDIHENTSTSLYAVNNGNSGWDVSLCITNFSTKTRLAIPSFAIESGGYYVLNRDTNDVSSDLITWKGNLGQEFTIYKDILFDGKRFVAVTNDTVISSLDGVTWESNYKVLGQNDIRSSHFRNIQYSNGKYYVYGSKWEFGWVSYVWVSDDLTNWQEYRININNYIENTNSNLSGINVTIIGNKAVLTMNSSGEEKTIIATSDDMYNFTPIMTYEPKFTFGEVYYYNNKYMVLSTEAGHEENLSSNPFYTVTKTSDFTDYIYISDDLKTFKKIKLPSEHVKSIYFFKDYFVFGADESPKFKLYLTKDFKKFEAYEIPSDRPNFNVVGNEDGIYDIFSIDDVLYITGSRIMYSKNFKDWTILDSLPYNGYSSFAIKDSFAVLGGAGIMARIYQSN